MTRRSSVLRDGKLPAAGRQMPAMAADPRAKLLNVLPLKRGWHRLIISGLGDSETVELRLDFGIGFIAHHGVRATAKAGKAALFVRLFKDVRGVELQRGQEAPHHANASIRFEPVPHLELWKRRTAEQLHLIAKRLRAAPATSPHERPRRLWGWAGLRAFPADLPATGESSCALWQRVHASDGQRYEPTAAFSEAPRSWNRSEPASTSNVMRVSVIIPTRDQPDLLKNCVESILARTDGGPAEIIIHDNASTAPAARRLLDGYADRPGFKVLRDEAPFNFSRINNEAAAVASGDILLFLNDDTEVISPEWLAELATVAADPAVGCAGALLVDRKGRVQHAGLITGPGGIAAHIYAGMRPEEADPAAPIVRREVSAVTGACMAIEKSKFLAVGGFDAEGLAVAFNDVDLCLRLECQGLRNVLVPEAKLMHLGSATRGEEDFVRGSQRFRAEFRLMRERWGPRLDFDPYFPEHMRLNRSRPELRLA